ncbi:MAG: efflux RND transporter permease subunit, partial [Bacteroidetes bacterium]|nr:efflux RND transporter permease subunit [Bacteroidota bacterium]
AIVSTTIALVAVFVPLAFLSGNVGRLFNEFGVAVAVAVLISGFVALTLTPMLSSKILKPLHGTSKGWASRTFDSFFDTINKIYDHALRIALNHRIILITSGLVLFLFAYGLFVLLPCVLVPVEDRGVAFGIVLAPEGATLEYTDSYVREIERRILPLPERDGLFTATGLGFGGPGSVTNSFMFLNLKPRSERDKSQQQIVQELFPKLITIPGVLAFVINPPSLGASFSSSPIEYVLQGESYEELNSAIGIMMSEAMKLGYLINLDTDLKLNKPQLDIHIDRERASGLGLSVTDIGSTLETFLGGRVVTDFKRGTKQYDVILQMKPDARSTPDAIQNIYLRGNGGLVPLANVVTVEHTVAPKELNHYNRIRSAKLTASLIPGVTIGQALDDLDRIAKEKLPPGIKREYAGQSLEYKTSSSALYFMFLLAIVFIYLVLSAQFESFVHPFTILLSVPLSVFGALLTLYVFGESLNIYSQIGMIMLIGLVTKNGILIVEFANQQRAQGLSINNAVIEAAKIRLRPILMTSLATIFGILPIAIGLGAGAESRRPLGLVIVGGMLFSTFLTLLIIPVVYSLLARFTSTSKIASGNNVKTNMFENISNE